MNPQEEQEQQHTSCMDLAIKNRRGHKPDELVNNPCGTYILSFVDMTLVELGLIHHFKAHF